MKSKFNSNISSTSSIPTISDWDRPFTDQELEAIESVIRDVSSSSPTKRRHTSSSEDCKVARRRLPNSISGIRQSNEFFTSKYGSVQSSNSFLLYSSPPCRSDEYMKSRHPVMNFGGRILYSKSVIEVEKAAAELLKFVEAKKQEMGEATLGFDIEWKPTFRRGVSPGKAAVMQICGEDSHCYVMHIVHSGITPNLRRLLEDPTSIKVGVGIANDCTKVFKDYNVSIQDSQDLSSLANQKLGGDIQKWSLKSLTERLACKQLEKPKNIQLGNWEANNLSKAQLHYAATDAFVSWFLYQVLKTFPDVADNKSEEQACVTPQ